MTTIEEQMKLQEKIIEGLAIAYKRMIEFKKQKNSLLVIMKDGKVVKVKPE